jgi:hypothetical protein
VIATPLTSLFSCAICEGFDHHTVSKPLSKPLPLTDTIAWLAVLIGTLPRKQRDIYTMKQSQHRLMLSHRVDALKNGFTGGRRGPSESRTGLSMT